MSEKNISPQSDEKSRARCSQLRYIFIETLQKLGEEEWERSRVLGKTEYGRYYAREIIRGYLELRKENL